MCISPKMHNRAITTLRTDIYLVLRRPHHATACCLDQFEAIRWSLLPCASLPILPSANAIAPSCSCCHSCAPVTPPPFLKNKNKLKKATNCLSEAAQVPLPDSNFVRAGQSGVSVQGTWACPGNCSSTQTTLSLLRVAPSPLGPAWSLLSLLCSCPPSMAPSCSFKTTCLPFLASALSIFSSLLLLSSLLSSSLPPHPSFF